MTIVILRNICGDYALYSPQGQMMFATSLAVIKSVIRRNG
jgi:hypothetical protein